MRKAYVLMENVHGDDYYDVGDMERLGVMMLYFPDQVDAERAKDKEEIERLGECLKMAGLSAFIKNGKPEEIAEHLGHVAKSYTEEIARLRETFGRIMGVDAGSLIGTHYRDTIMDIAREALEGKDARKD